MKEQSKTPIPPRIADAVLNGVQSMSAASLERLAKSQGSLLEYLEREWGWPVAMARRLISAVDMAALRALTPRDFDDFLDVILADCPEQGMVFFDYKAWYLREMAHVQKVLTQTRA